MGNSIKIPADLVAQLNEIGIFPTDLVLYINSACNLRCQHCYIGNELLNAAESYSEDELNCFVNQFLSLDRVTVLGGEPLLHKGINSILGNLLLRPIRECRMTTNLTFLHNFNHRRFANERLRLCVSLDGHNAETHDFIRGRGNFTRTVRNILLMVEEGFDVEITHTVMSHNLSHFAALVALCKQMGLKRLNLHRISPHGNALLNQELAVTPAEWVSLVGQIKDMALRSSSHEEVGLAVRFPLLFVSSNEFNHLIKEGRYHHHVKGSFYSDTEGHRVVLYPDGKLFISSEAFGTEGFIGHLEAGRFIYNPDKRNEMKFFPEENPAHTEAVSHLQTGDANYPKVLSVSFKQSVSV